MNSRKEVGTGVVQEVEHTAYRSRVCLHHDGESPTVLHGYTVSRLYAEACMDLLGKRVHIYLGEKSPQSGYEDLELVAFQSSDDQIEPPGKIEQLRSSYKELQLRHDLLLNLIDELRNRLGRLHAIVTE